MKRIFWGVIVLCMAGFCPAPIKDPRGMNQKPVPEATEAQLLESQKLVKVVPQVGLVPQKEGANPTIPIESSQPRNEGAIDRVSRNLDGKPQSSASVVANAEGTIKHRRTTSTGDFFLTILMIALGLGCVQVVRKWAASTVPSSLKG